MKKILLLLVTILPSFWAVAQDDGAWNDFLQRRNFNEYKQQREASLQAYKDSINKAFAAAVEKRWEEYQVFVGQRRPVKPEPEMLPVAPKDTLTKESVRLPVDKIISLPESSSDNNLDSESRVLSDSLLQDASYLHIDVDFYNRNLQFDVPAISENFSLIGVSEKSVSKFWTDLSDGSFDYCLTQLKEHRKQFHLNDWAVYEVARSVALNTFPAKYAEQTVFVVFLLNQLGLDAKIGRTNNQLLVLLPAKSTLYAVSYVRCNNETYYIYSCYPNEQSGQSAISTYPVSFPAPTSPLDLNIDEPIRFDYRPSEITYISDFWGDAVPFKVNQNAIDFYNRYPQVDVVIYANAEMSEDLKLWADKQIKPFLDDLDMYEAVNVLLYYVQTEFDYATDQQQFGYEKPFFCEENFYYAKNDCEDRAILFSYLIRNLVKTPIVLLDYPDHIATAVAFEDDSEITGDYYLIDGRRFFVCDPTYIGANIGETMPQYRGVGANVIKLKEQIIK